LSGPGVISFELLRYALIWLWKWGPNQFLVILSIFDCQQGQKKYIVLNFVIKIFEMALLHEEASAAAAPPLQISHD
jgi:hypothetical protein